MASVGSVSVSVDFFISFKPQLKGEHMPYSPISCEEVSSEKKTKSDMTSKDVPS